MHKFIRKPYYEQFYKSLHDSAENNYKKAIAALNLLQTNVEDIMSKQLPQEKLRRLNYFLLKCGLEIKELEKQLSVIHVSGTKGKGSTCAFCESILRNYGYKTGFFSSPHLVTVRERIRINGCPINREKFSSYFWKIYKQLEQCQDVENDYFKMPSYFMFLTIMALKVFKEENVDVAIIEVGIGGEYDYTNLFSNTAVTGISSLGYDHVKLLGNTIEEITWHKAGIMKPGSITITSEHQPKTSLNILQKRAIEKKCSLYVSTPMNTNDALGNRIELGIKGPAQWHNASLAVQLINAWLNPQDYRTESFEMKSTPSVQLSKEILNGLRTCCWPGRTQIFKFSSELTYYLDGAHTLESIQYCVSWFQENIPHHSLKSKKVLVFNMTGSRNVEDLIKLFIPCNFDFVFFCTNRIQLQDIFSDNQNLKINEPEEYNRIIEYRNYWLKLNKYFNSSNTKVFRNVSEAHMVINNLSVNQQLHVLVTGSLHLVGAFLNLLDPELKLSCSLV